MLIKFQNISYGTRNTFINGVKQVHEYFGEPLYTELNQQVELVLLSKILTCTLLL